MRFATQATNLGTTRSSLQFKRRIAPRDMLSLALVFLSAVYMNCETAIGQTKVIAHRGASGYCAEHSEGAKALAHAQRADYIEQDIVLSKDKVFVVLHDLTLNATTNVQEIFPDRARTDGKFYVADFTWEELEKLELRSRGTESHGGCGQRIMRLDHEIVFLRQLDRAFERKTGLYIELKGAAFHNKEFGLHMGEELSKLLQKLEVPSDPESCLIQCFEADELIRLRESGCPYRLIQLLGDRFEVNLESIAKYAYGIGPSLNMLAKREVDSAIESTGLVENAKQLGLKVHPYTVRRQMQPKWSTSLDETHRVLLETLRVDGFFTDYPDLGRSAVDKLSK